jgi:hypothetical protein
MLQISEILKTLIKNNVNSSQGRQCFHNYLYAFCKPDEFLLPETVDRFFQSCFDFVHWQQNPGELCKSVQDSLRISGINLKDNEWKDFRWPDKYQVIDVIQMEDVKDIVHQYLRDYYKDGQQFRIIKEGNRKYLVYILDASKNLTVKLFDPKFMIQHGRLEPLKKDNALYFNDNLELQPDLDQKMELAPYLYAQFRLQDNLVYGGLVRGYMFQKYQEFKGVKLVDIPRLFYAVKRIEQFAVHRDTDTFYQELVSELELHCKQLKLMDPVSVKIFPDLLVRAQNALEYVYQNDRLLTLMLKEFQSSYSQDSISLSTESAEFANDASSKDVPWRTSDLTN